MKSLELFCWPYSKRYLLQLQALFQKVMLVHVSSLRPIFCSEFRSRARTSSYQSARQFPGVPQCSCSKQWTLRYPIRSPKQVVVLVVPIWLRNLTLTLIDTVVVMLAKVSFDVVPEVAQIDKIKVECKSFFTISHSVSNGISVGAEVGLLVARLEIFDKRLKHGFFALCCQSFVIRL